MFANVQGAPATAVFHPEDEFVMPFFTLQIMRPKCCVAARRTKIAVILLSPAHNSFSFTPIITLRM